MDKIKLLEVRKAAILAAGKSVREKINELVDRKSFVEYERFSFSKNTFNGECIYGEGVITGVATVMDETVYIVAQNPDVKSGGLSYAAAEKIRRCISRANAAGAPIIYLLSSKGVQVGDGIKVMEGVSAVLAEMQIAKGSVPQIGIAFGDVLGSNALIAACCDYLYVLDGACVAYASPLVIAAKSGKMLDKTAVGGAKALAACGITAFEAADFKEVKKGVCALLNVLSVDGEDYDDDPNRNAPALNVKADAKSVIDAVFDKGTFIELGKGLCSEVVTGIGRVGGYAVAALAFDGEDGVKLNAQNVEKITEFIDYAVSSELPLLSFINVCGIEDNLETAGSFVMKGVAKLVAAQQRASRLPQISVITGKAIGLGYSLFASRAMNKDFLYAFANAKISVFESEVGAQIEYGASGGDLEKIKADYEENEQDAITAAELGFVDSIIEPEFVRSYIISALQTLM